MDPVIYTGRSSRYVERKYNGRVESRDNRIQVCGRIFDKFKEVIWQRRRRIDKGSKVEKVGTRKENNGGVCIRV